MSPEADGLKDVQIDRELNGRSILTFSLSILPGGADVPVLTVKGVMPTVDVADPNAKWQYITDQYRIYAGGREFVVLNPDAIEKERDGKKLWGKVTAHESWVLLGKKYATVSNDPQTPDPPPLAVIIVSGGNDLSGGRYPVGSAAHALYAILQGTGWSVGTVDVTGTHDLETEKESVLANIQKVQETWGGYLVWDSVAKTVSLRSESTWALYTGYQVRYAKNLKGITRTDDYDIITRLYPFGKDDLNIGSVNGGVLYLNNNTYTTDILEGVWVNQDIDTAAELKTEAEKYLAKVCHPRHNYQVSQADLRTLSGYTHEDFDLGHMVDVIDSDLGINVQARIIRYKYNVFQPWQCALEVGDPIDKDANLLADSQQMVKYLDAIKTTKGQITAYKLVPESIIAEKIAKAAVDATKLNTKTVILLGDTWTDNSPSPGYVSWNQHKLYYAGVEHVIAAGNTIQKYIYWDGVSAAYSASAALPDLTDGQFYIAVNNDGLHDIVWNSPAARKFIGSLFIADAAIKTAHIDELAVTSGKIASLDANKVNVTDLTALSSGDGYTQMKSDGIRVYDASSVLQVHMGQYAAGQFGLLAKQGRIEADLLIVNKVAGALLDLVDGFGDGRDGALTTGATISLAADDTYTVVKQYTSFNLPAGQTLTVDKRVRGLVIFCRGDVTISGTINMSGKSAKADRSESIQRFIQVPVGTLAWEIPAGGPGGDGGSGGSGWSAGGSGRAGTAGLWIGGGWGGAGGGGSGGGEDSYPGGTGGAGGTSDLTIATGASGTGGTQASRPGGQGGNFSGGGGGAGNAAGTGPAGGGGGGAGFNGGYGGEGRYGGAAGSNGSSISAAGGGLVIIIAKGNVTINSGGQILASGINGGAGGAGGSDGGAYGADGNGGGGQGGGGGGTVFIALKGIYTNSGTINVNGGAGGAGGLKGGDIGYPGFAGTAGSAGQIKVVQL